VEPVVVEEESGCVLFHCDDATITIILLMSTTIIDSMQVADSTLLPTRIRTTTNYYVSEKPNVDKNERVCVSLLQRLGTLEYGRYLIFILLQYYVVV
jgi:hypothetical protein